MANDLFDYSCEAERSYLAVFLAFIIENFFFVNASPNPVIVHSRSSFFV